MNTGVDNRNIYNQNHIYFYQNLILLTIHNANKLHYSKIFLYTETSVGGI